MNATLSTRQLQLVGLLVLVVVAAAGFMVVSKKHSPSTSTTASSTPAHTTPAQTTPASSKAHSHTVAPVKLATHGLPVSVALALRKNSVVVVSLTTPRGQDDESTSLEAAAAAEATQAGYVNIDVFSQRPGTAILRKLGVADTPAVLVVKRPGVIYSDFKGFVDRTVVAQAVSDAR
jgi:hypothetical protein